MKKMFLQSSSWYSSVRRMVNDAPHSEQVRSSVSFRGCTAHKDTCQTCQTRKASNISRNIINQMQTTFQWRIKLWKLWNLVPTCAACILANLFSFWLFQRHIVRHSHRLIPDNVLWCHWTIVAFCVFQRCRKQCFGYEIYESLSKPGLAFLSYRQRTDTSLSPFFWGMGSCPHVVICKGTDWGKS